MNLRRTGYVLLALVAIVAGVALLVWSNGSQAAPPDYERTPIVFVHGQGLYSGSFRRMQDELHAAGWPEEYLAAIDFEPEDGPNIPEAREQLAPFIEQALERANRARQRERPSLEKITSVAIVAHSMGSLSSRWYIARMHPERISAWISIAGPNHGSSRSCPPRAGSGDIDMCPAYAASERVNPLQFALNGGPGPDVDESPWGHGQDHARVRRIAPDAHASIGYLTLRLPKDEYIEPADSIVLDGAGGFGFECPAELRFKETSPGNFLMLDPVHHDVMPADARVIAFVRLALERLDSMRRTS